MQLSKEKKIVISFTDLFKVVTINNRRKSGIKSKSKIQKTAQRNIDQKYAYYIMFQFFYSLCILIRTVFLYWSFSIWIMAVEVRNYM